ncbi:MAG: NAD(P)(+) transhydrogenase (Re/Si-specific) subunit beta, partial [Clostridiales bacterium]|nr:NAD(P)(+) transhydrogenase (Re/Si-specific) subunit beta [Clostridiales bacterium]
DIPYDKLFEMDEINPDIHNTDIVFVVGANDVVNPAANTAQGTPIYGMPVLDAQKARKLVICNFDKKPGYAGVENPLYDSNPNILLMLGDAKDSLQKIINLLE